MMRKVSCVGPKKKNKCLKASSIMKQFFREVRNAEKSRSEVAFRVVGKIVICVRYLVG